MLNGVREGRSRRLCEELQPETDPVPTGTPSLCTVWSSRYVFDRLKLQLKRCFCGAMQPGSFDREEGIELSFQSQSDSRRSTEGFVCLGAAAAGGGGVSLGGLTPCLDCCCCCCCLVCLVCCCCYYCLVCGCSSHPARPNAL